MDNGIPAMTRELLQSSAATTWQNIGVALDYGAKQLSQQDL